MNNLGWSATDAVRVWLRENGLDTHKYQPVSMENLKKAAKKAGLVFWKCADGEEIILSFRQGAVWPPRGISGLFFKFRRYIPSFLRAKIWNYPPNRYLEIRKFGTFDSGSSIQMGPEPAPAWVCTTPVSWVRDEITDEIIAVKAEKKFLCGKPYDHEYEGSGLEDIPSPARLLEKEIVGDQEEVIPIFSPLVEVSLPNGKVVAFKHEAPRLVREAEEREREKMEEARQSLKALAEIKTTCLEEDTEIIEMIDKIFECLGDSQKEATQKAIGLALDRHSVQLRVDGEPYVNHVLRVGAAVSEYALEKMPEQLGVLVPAAILHDILEDTPTTDEELREQFGQEVARIVRALSHEQEEEPDEIYLARIVRGGKLAVLIKRFDCLDNTVCLAKAPESFRAKKMAERKASLPIWERIDPEGAVEIKKALENLEETE